MTKRVLLGALAVVVLAGATQLGNITTYTAGQLFASTVDWVSTPSIPSAPASGRQEFLLQPLTGLPSFLGSISATSGMPIFQQAFTGLGAGRSTWGCSIPTSHGGSTIGAYGFGSSSGNGVGTQAGIGWANTDLLTRTPGVNMTTAASIDTVASLRNNLRTFWRGNGSAGVGGFWFVTSFAIRSANTGQRLFAGVHGVTTGLPATNTEPSAFVDSAYVGCDTGDANLSYCTNDNTAAAACTTLGANFPCKTAGAAYTVLILAPAGGSTISFGVERIDAAFTATPAAVAAQLPRNTSLPGSWEVAMETGHSDSTAVSFDFFGECHVSNP